MTTYRRPQGKQSMRRTTYGKGDAPRYVDKEKFDEAFDRIFGKKEDKKEKPNEDNNPRL
jgi:uncharacterized protein with von Willebrand factor type A (vWA) domain